MESWTYFRIIALVWGLAAIIPKPLLFGIGGGAHWREWLLQRAYQPNERPAWVNATAILAALLIAFTWYQVFASPVYLGWVLATLMTLSTGKVIKLLFDYASFATFVQQTLTDRQKENRMVIAVTAAGLVLAALAFFLY